MTTLKRLNVSDGSWDALHADWERQCAEFGEQLDNVASADFQMLKEAATNQLKSGSFALPYENEFAAACQLNCSPLPGYVGPVLRLRFLTLSPRLDLGPYDEDVYSSVLLHLLIGVLQISDTLWQADHIKFHLASPADRTFFAALGTPLSTSGVFESVCVKGSWLYITKSSPTGLGT